MQAAGEVLAGARDAYRRREWFRARDGFVAARRHGPLTADDLTMLADAAWWLGWVHESTAAGEEAYHAYQDEQQPRKAAMAAIGVAVNAFLRGDDVIGSGWMSRAQRLLDGQAESAEHGYALYLMQVEGALEGPDLHGVATNARKVQEIGRRHGDANLVAAGTVGEGRALLRQGRVPDGMALLDEAMVAVLDGDLSPDWAGNVYCHLIAACYELGDIFRAAAWTEATARWLRTLPVAAVFTGICRVHRSQILQIAGAWTEAEQEAARVCEDLAEVHVASVAEGYYQLGELRRLRGDHARATDAYDKAHRRGRDPQPGLALLRLAEGHVAAAAASIRAALTGETRPLVRFRLCAAQVEIALSAGDVEAAAAASAELDDIAAVYASSGFGAASRQAKGAVRLAQRRPEEALGVLRDSCARWRELNAPYDVARVRILLADAYHALGDPGTARRERAAAEAALTQLGAPPHRAKTLPGGLTERECEVLAFVAAGKTNRQVAGALVISEKTVARHLSNIFTKLEVSSRTEAAAYAFEHGLTATASG